MTMPFIRVGLFAGAIALVYLLAIRWCVDRFRGKEPRSRFDLLFRSRGIGAVLLGLAAAGLACMAYGFIVEPYWLAVKTYNIETPKIPKDEQVRIVHLADLHVRGNGPRERRLPELVQSLRPDLILHTGDLFGSAESSIEPVVAGLARSWDVPQYACKGNLDGLDRFERTLRSAGVTVLNNSRAEETIRGARLRIAGFKSGAESQMPRALPQLFGPDTFNIVLYHHPQGFPCTWNTPADLMLAGHTHGGQIRLPWYGALITLDRFGKRYESGFFEERGKRLIVSRGIGCEPYTPEVRFLCRPEVVVIDIIGTGT